MKTNQHVGSSFDNFLQEEGLLAEATGSSQCQKNRTEKGEARQKQAADDGDGS